MQLHISLQLLCHLRSQFAATHSCCAVGAACVSDKCTCPSPTKGIGNFHCALPSQPFCAIFNDPMVRDFAGGHVLVPLPVKFLVAHIANPICVETTPGTFQQKDGMCEVHVYAWGGRQLGKTFVKGVEVKVFVSINATTSYFHSTRIQGEARNWSYTFTEEGSSSMNPSSDYSDRLVTILPGYGEIKTVYDEKWDNFVQLVIGTCGVTVGFRPVELDNDPLLYPAGMYVSVVDDCDPQFLSVENSLCAPRDGPSLEEQTDTFFAQYGESISKEVLAFYKVVTGDVMQDYPGYPTIINQLHEVAHECDPVNRIISALEYCMFIIDSPNFFRCFDSSTDASVMLETLETCIFAFCSHSTPLCNDVKSRVINSRCAVPTTLTILDKNCNIWI
ncbi:uncharacterized protein LOC131952254 [Physella acuta]|uniref:uncharacterized protein LOC131952254 n=1 Tax=Physella acuta TaxID=109671 RepID=UPI0027DB4567|nr:uncharacterized protein LOC131952254 [Physella acuta]